jgi:hypothetical protein
MLGERAAQGAGAEALLRINIGVVSKANLMSEIAGSTCNPNGRN